MVVKSRRPVATGKGSNSLPKEEARDKKSAKMQADIKNRDAEGKGMGNAHLSGASLAPISLQDTSTSITGDDAGLEQGAYWLTRIVLLRALCGIYFLAFLVALEQNSALVGQRGLTPFRCASGSWVSLPHVSNVVDGGAPDYSPTLHHPTQPNH